MLQDGFGVVYFRVLAHLNHVPDVDQYICILSRGSNLGPCKARHHNDVQYSFNNSRMLYFFFFFFYPLNARANT